MTSTPDFPEVLDFWLGPADSASRGRPLEAWFRKSDDFDTEIRTRFLPAWELAARGGLDHWQATPLAGLALAIVLDQFPRNMFRGTPRAFASDARALALARRLVDRGFDRVLRPVERQFVYLPFEHAEELATQESALVLIGSIDRDVPGSDLLEYARRHHEIIARFGRFPHRNAILGRASTPEEVEFLRQPGSGF